MAQGPEWISPRFITHHDGLHLSGVSLAEITEFVPPPFYVYDANIIRDQYKSLDTALSPHGIDIFFSMKANPNLAVVHLLHSLGSGLEIASKGELAALERLEILGDNISFAGPVKSDAALEAAINYGVFGINVEGEDEFGRISEIAKRLGVTQRVGIRVNPQFEVAGATVKMGGGPKQFGIDYEKIDPEFVARVQALPNINLIGVHIFAASQILDTNVFLRNIGNSLKVAEALNNFFPVRYLDLGGGLGIPYQPEDSKLPLDEISQSLGDLLEAYSFLKSNLTKIYMEPGRFLVGPSGIYVTQVDNVHQSRGETFARVNGGIHQMLRPALIGGAGHPIYNLSRLQEDPTTKITVTGELCTPLDKLGIAMMPKTQKGDLIGVFNAGAYGWSEAMQFFLSHPTAPEVMVGNGRWQIIRDRISPEEFLKGQYTFRTY